jgi:hypothetical protein
MNINPNLLEIKYDEARGELFMENDFMRRINITSARDALNEYQKGKCFYTFQDISVISGSSDLFQVDHFLRHVNKQFHRPANINGVWNLVLAKKDINSTANKGSKVPHNKYLNRLYNRNEFLIASKHPLSETIINQTGSTPESRKAFLESHYNIALSNSIHKWTAREEMPASF